MTYRHAGTDYVNRQLVFPLLSNASWDNDRISTAKEVVITWQEKCKVDGAEKVSVKAGDFDAPKILCKGFFSNSAGARGSFERITWYSHSAKRYVKMENKSWIGSRLNTQSSEELTSFKLTASH